MVQSFQKVQWEVIYFPYLVTKTRSCCILSRNCSIHGENWEISSLYKFWVPVKSSISDIWDWTIRSFWVQKLKCQDEYAPLFPLVTSFAKLLAQSFSNHELPVLKLEGEGSWNGKLWNSQKVEIAVNYTSFKTVSKQNYIYRWSSEDKILSSLIKKTCFTGTFLNPIQDGLFWGCSRMDGRPFWPHPA